MFFYGIDFTSAPSKRKPITVVIGVREQFFVDFYHLEYMTNFDQFEALINEYKPYFAGIDFPFGLPAKLVKDMSWGETWEEYVSKISTMSMAEYLETLANYRKNQVTGLREIDKLTGSRVLYSVAGGKMFFQGAPRLLKSNVNVLPFRSAKLASFVVEAYPALVARRWIGKARYKSDIPQKQTEAQKAAREKIVEGLHKECREYYGLSSHIYMAKEAIADPTGDILDAVLCAVQAMWAFGKTSKLMEKNQLEGWIADPSVI